MATKGTDTLDTASLQALLGPQMTAEHAALIFQQGQEAVVFALLTLAKQLAEKQRDKSRRTPSQPPRAGPSPKAPSSVIPVIVARPRLGSIAARTTP